MTGIPAPLSRRGAAGVLGAAGLAVAWGPPAVAATPALPPEPALGDWKVAVTPQVFGFLVEGGVLRLKLGGVDSAAPGVALRAGVDGLWRLQEGHPNAFEFRTEGGRTRFFLWSAGQAFEGQRLAPPGPAASGAAAAPGAAAGPAVRLRRAQAAELPALAAGALAPGAGSAARLAWVQCLFELGEFERAHAEAVRWAAAEDVPDAALALCARLDTMLGRLDAAAAQWQRLLSRHAGMPARQMPAWIGSLFVHYQRNRLDTIAALPLPAGVVLPLREQARAFTEAPYQLRWPGPSDAEQETRVPLLALDPLPLLPARINGRAVNLLLDTGADQLIVDTELARTLGLIELAQADGQFAGGQSAAVGFARIDALGLAGLELRQLPVQTLPTRRFGFDSRWSVDGILGTAVLRQVLATLDYAQGALVLRAPDAAGRARLHAATPGAQVWPFVLDATHLVFVRGRLDDQGPHTLFLDTGLAAAEALVLPTPTLLDLGLPIPPLDPEAPGRGGGPGPVPRARVALRSVALGGLRMERPGALLGPLPDSSYRARGFIQDGLLSHRFFRRHRSLSLDFEQRRLRIEP